LEERETASSRIEILTITLEHLLKITELPKRHRDTFDRLLVEQCLVERMSLVSTDVAMDSYGVDRIW